MKLCMLVAAAVVVSAQAKVNPDAVIGQLFGSPAVTCAHPGVIGRCENEQLGGVVSYLCPDSCGADEPDYSVDHDDIYSVFAASCGDSKCKADVDFAICARTCGNNAVIGQLFGSPAVTCAHPGVIGRCENEQLGGVVSYLCPVSCNTTSPDYSVDHDDIYSVFAASCGDSKCQAAVDFAICAGTCGASAKTVDPMLKSVHAPWALDDAGKSVNDEGDAASPQASVFAIGAGLAGFMVGVAGTAFTIRSLSKRADTTEDVGIEIGEVTTQE